MDSRSKILAKVAAAKRENSVLPEVTAFDLGNIDNVQKFKDTLRGIGGAVVELKTKGGINEYILQQFPHDSRIVSMVEEISSETYNALDSAHSFETVDLFIMAGHFAVAENAAVWVTADKMGDRVLPFVCQHLALVVDKTDILPTLHQAYPRIQGMDYEFGTFIAGPSKTADIEQSLVLGAHGPKTLTVFLLG